MESTIRNITFIGSGNVGTQLSKQFFHHGYKIDAILNSSNQEPTDLVQLLQTQYIDDIKQIPSNSDAYIIAVNDDQYVEIIDQFPYKNKLMIHTSGSLESSKFEKKTSRWCCLYPLQTISKTKKVNWDKVSFYLEAAKKDDYSKLLALCSRVGFKHEYADSKKRKRLHVAAVITNNFTYHLMSSVKTYCLKNNIDFDHLKSLLDQSIENILKENPFVLQTGPAVRKDTEIIENHLDLLKNEQDLKEIYNLFSKQIIQKHHHEL